MNSKGAYKFNNGNTINYTYNNLNNIDFQLLIQSLVSLSEKLYDETLDSVEGSYEIDKIIDTLINYQEP